MANRHYHPSRPANEDAKRWNNSQGKRSKAVKSAEAEALRLGGSLEERLRGIFCEVLGLDNEQLAFESRLGADLGADSLDLVELCVELEEREQIIIPDSVDLERYKTFGDWLGLAANPPKEASCTSSAIDA